MTTTRLPSEELVDVALEMAMAAPGDTEETNPLHDLVREDPDRMLVGLARSARRLHTQLGELVRERRTVEAEYKMAEAQVKARLERLDTELELIITARVQQQVDAGDNKPRKSIKVPGAGTLKLTKVPGGWKVLDADAALAWLETTEHIDAEKYKSTRTVVELDRKALVADAEEIAKSAEGEIPDGMENVKDRESFSFKAS